MLSILCGLYSPTITHSLDATHHAKFGTLLALLLCAGSELDSGDCSYRHYFCTLIGISREDAIILIDFALAAPSASRHNAPRGQSTKRLLRFVRLMTTTAALPLAAADVDAGETARNCVVRCRVSCSRRPDCQRGVTCSPRRWLSPVRPHWHCESRFCRREEERRK